MDRQINIGTRASPLALVQTTMIREDLQAAHGWDDDTIKAHELITRGDAILDKPLAEIGGKGLFTQELEDGLRDGGLDLAVHSLKDLPTEDAAGLTLAAICPREDVRDVFVPREGLRFDAALLTAEGLSALPQGAKIGTASLRRRAQLLRARPDLQISSLRGNVGTRLGKIISEGLDGTILAMAGLNRLAMMPDGAVPLDPDLVIPAAGQGALAVQCRADDDEMRGWLAALECAETRARVTAERHFLNALDGSCRTPIAALAQMGDDGQLSLHGRLLSDDGDDWAEARQTAPLADAAALGVALADQLKAEKPHLVARG
jgi:hydroxymethylbilane synthase